MDTLLKKYAEKIESIVLSMEVEKRSIYIEGALLQFLIEYIELREERRGE